MAPTASAPPRPKLWSMEFMSTKWPRFFMGVVTLQAILCLVFEAYVFAKFQSSLGPQSQIAQTEADAQKKTIPTFLTLFIFGFLYELVLVWDALRMKNTIQIIGVCIANLALLVYTTIQVDQIREAIDVLAKYGGLNGSKEQAWQDVQGYLIAIPCILGLTTLAMIFLSWKLYQEFAWDILKQIGADYRMKNRFLHYQVYIALLKFDFFFFLGFMVQFLVVVIGQTPNDSEFGFTIAVIPVTIAILIAAYICTRREIMFGMVCIILLFLGALSYFVFKLVRMNQPRFTQVYKPVYKSLTAFAVITILLILLTITNAIICIRNFNHGLKNYLVTSGRREEEKADNAVILQDIQQPTPSRMVID